MVVCFLNGGGTEPSHKGFLASQVDKACLGESLVHLGGQKMQQDYSPQRLGANSPDEGRLVLDCAEINVILKNVLSLKYINKNFCLFIYV